MSYAIISVGGKQYRVREGERLLVDRLSLDDGATFAPTVLLSGGDGEPQIAPAGVVVTAKVVAQAKGPKLTIGKYRKRTGYKRHTGFRASLTQIEIESIGKGRAAAKKAETPEKAAAKAAPKPKAEEPKAAENVAALPEGYADMTVAQVKEGVSGWSREQVEAAIAYEQGHANRKGAMAALEGALKEEEG